jgi:hypothetical protein
MNITKLVKVNLVEGNARLNKAFEDVEGIISEYNEKGYKVVSVSPLTTGNCYSNLEETISYSHSYTIGVLVVFEKCK